MFTLIRLWILFQIHATRFFQQFLTDIVLRATDRNLPFGLIKEIINLALIKKEDISNTRGINLFLLSDIHPSAELRYILLELAFRESERLETKLLTIYNYDIIYFI